MSKQKMFKLITCLFPNDTNSQPNEEESFIRFRINVNGKVSQDLLPQLTSWILGVSVAGGGIYGISTMLTASNSEVINDSTPTESVEKSSSRLGNFRS